jgi:hypothetical protein
MQTHWHDEDIPYFAWDRPLTVGQIRAQLQAGASPEWARLAAWIMREAAVGDVWQFLTPREVYGRRTELLPLLGRRRGFWEYILRTWHELGKL